MEDKFTIVLERDRKRYELDEQHVSCEKCVFNENGASNKRCPRNKSGSLLCMCPPFSVWKEVKW